MRWVILQSRQPYDWVGMRPCCPNPAAGHQYQLVGRVNPETRTAEDNKLMSRQPVVPSRETSHQRPVAVRHNRNVYACRREADHLA